MNILYLVNHLDTGGISSYILALGKGLKAKGHNLWLASWGGELLSRFEEEGFNFLAVPMKTKFELSPKLWFSKNILLRFLRDNRMDILHSNTRTTSVLADSLSRRTGIVHVYTCHGFFKRRLSRLLFPSWGMMNIAISEPVKEHLMSDFGLAEDKISVIHNGIDLQRFEGNAFQDKRKYKLALGLKDAPVIGIIARLSDVKGHAYLLQAMKKVLESFSDSQLLIVGKGRMEARLRKLASELKIESSVLFIPSIADTRQALSATDIFVMPSLQEGLGLALMEAMAFGLPCIGSAVGGINALLEDGVNGIRVPPANKDALSKAIEVLLRNKDKAQALAEQARIFIRNNFSHESMVAHTEELYSRCIGRRDSTDKR